MISVREVPEPGQLDAFEDGLLLPVPALETNAIVLEPRDGHDVRRAVARSMSFRVAGQTMATITDTRMDVHITAARVAVACTKYHKGFGGGVITGSASRMLAAAKRHGKMLVGQVRYPSLQYVGSLTKFGWQSKEKLILIAPTTEGRASLTFVLPGDLDAPAMAAEIARRAAAYRLACEPDLEPEVRSRLEELAAAQRIEPDKAHPDDVKGFTMPAPWVFGEESARFRPDGGAGSGRATASPVGRGTAPVAQAAPAPAPSPRFCSQCGAPLTDTAFCTSCGARVAVRERA